MQKVFHDIHDRRPLEEDQNLKKEHGEFAVRDKYLGSTNGTNLVIRFEQFRQDSIKQFKLPGRSPDLVRRPTSFACYNIDICLRRREHERMLADFPQLNDHVLQRRATFPTPVDHKQGVSESVARDRQTAYWL
jgi:hypothetical protein